MADSPGPVRLSPSTIRSLTAHWFWPAIGVPFVLTRLGLILAAYLAQIFPLSRGYPFLSALQRGWEHTPLRFIDVWARWDAVWYIQIMREGYSVTGDLATTQSSIAFYPLYPYLVRILAWPAYALTGSKTVLILVGILVSNICFLGALVLLVKLAVRLGLGQSTGERAALYLLVFPTSFIFSSLYTESTFLFFLLLAFYTALQGRWLWAGLAAAALTLTRPLGPLVLLPLGILYLDAIRWDLRQIKPDLLWLGLSPLALLAHMIALLPVTGSLLAIFQNQAAWYKGFAWPWETFLHPYWYNPGISLVDQWVIPLTLLLGLVALWRLPSRAYGLFTLIFFLPPLFTGQINSLTRYASVLFPIFLVLALWGRRPAVHKAILILFGTILVIFMLAWSQFYWVQ